MKVVVASVYFFASSSGTPFTFTSTSRAPAGRLASNENWIPETCGKPPGCESSALRLTPCSSAARNVAPVTSIFTSFVIERQNREHVSHRQLSRTDHVVGADRSAIHEPDIRRG